MLKQTMQTFTSRAAIAVLSFACLTAEDAQAQCTTNAWTSTTGPVAAIGPETSPTGLPYEGSCGLTVDTANAPAFVTTGAPANETLLLSRFYLYPESLDLSSGDVEIFKARGNNATQFMLSLRMDGDDLVLVTSYRSGDSLVESGNTIPLQPVWQAINLGWSSSPISGSVTVKVNGVQKLAVNDLVNDGEFISNIDMGVINDPAATGTLVLDAFEARRVQPEPPVLTVNELINISTRAEAGVGVNAVVAGFIITGDTPKCVVVVGRGQSLPVPIPTLSDPTLTIRNALTGDFIDFNDDWQDHADASLINPAWRPQFASEAAVYLCLEPGLYTADLTGALGQGSGLGIVEVYDTDVTTSNLFNISTRAQTLTGDRVVIAGFVIQGDVPREVVIRGRGPTVAVPDAKISDPRLQLMSGANIVTINDNWQDAANSDDIREDIKPTNNLESAILAVLDPGAYTVIMSSNDGQPGIGIIEVFDTSGSSVESN